MKPFSFLHLIILLICLWACGSTSEQKGDASEQSVPEEARESQTYPQSDSGIYFEARGSEPFWALDISSGIIKLKMPEDSVFTPHTPPDTVSQAGVSLYSIETEAAQMNIRILPQACADPMSGEEFSYTVEVEYKRTAEAEFTPLQGCGDYTDE